jgi:6-phosphofructokinase 1
MGRNAGYIAVHTGLAVGALITLIPERKTDVDKDIVAKMKFTRKIGKKHFIIITAEGACHAEGLAEEIEAKTGIESRATILGHVQRGGAPSLRDRVAASRIGYYAVDLLSRGITNRVIAFHDEDLVDFDIADALAMKKTLDLSLLTISETLST